MAQIQLPKNIIKMFNNIQINGIDYKTEETAVSPSAQQILAENRESAQNILQSSIEQEIGQEVKAVELNETLHNVKDELARNNILKEVSTRASEITRVEGLIESEASTRASTDAKLQKDIEAEASTRASTDATLNNNINTINSKIPSQASKTNQLADKAFVNSSIATNTANFIGTFTDIEELKRQPATNNDYAFWLTTDSAGNILFKRYKYIASTNSWVFEYDLNNSSFTSEQWLAIQSGITAVLVAKLKGIEEGAQIDTVNARNIAISRASSLALTSASNLNLSLADENVNRVLFHYFASTATNAPVATAGFVITHCMSKTSAVQIAFCGKQIFTRTLSGTTWSAWNAMWNTEES